MNVIQTYQQGGRHKKNNQPCEDRTFTLSENGVDVIALADGAGNAKYTHSAEGAECVTKTISKFFCNNFDKFYEKQDNEELGAVLITVCQNALEKKAEELGLDSIVRLSSTLLCVAIKNDDVIVCHIGDGAIGKLTRSDMKVVSLPDNGEFASTTYFVTSPSAYNHIRIVKEKLDDTLSYFLMSDGTADYLFNKAENNFYPVTKKMVLMSLEKDGQIGLEKTVKNYMVDKDSRSDDCSFICLSKDVKLEEVYDVEDVIKEEKQIIVQENKKIEDRKTDDISLNKKAQNKTLDKKKTAICVAVACVIVLTLLTSALKPNHKKTDKTLPTYQTQQYTNKESYSTTKNNTSKKYTTKKVATKATTTTKKVTTKATTTTKKVTTRATTTTKKVTTTKSSTKNTTAKSENESTAQSEQLNETSKTVERNTAGTAQISQSKKEVQ